MLYLMLNVAQILKLLICIYLITVGFVRLSLYIKG